MSKFAVRALGAALRQKLLLEGFARRIHVSTVLPAAIDTPIFTHSANYTGHRPVAMPPVYTSWQVARTVTNVIRMPRPAALKPAAGCPCRNPPTRTRSPGSPTHSRPADLPPGVPPVSSPPATASPYGSQVAPTA